MAVCPAEIAANGWYNTVDKIKRGKRLIFPTRPCISSEEIFEQFLRDLSTKEFLFISL